MKFEPTTISDVVIVRQTPIRDQRGEFARIFCVDELAGAGLQTDYPQENRSVCRHAGTLRGLHYQVPPYGEAKLVRCTRGRVIDVAVDIRKGSSTFLQWVAVELDDSAGKMLYVPPGFAHGYQALQDGVEVCYRASAPYHPQSERQIRFDDPRLRIAWPIPTPHLSDKDAHSPHLSDEFEGVAI